MMGSWALIFNPAVSQSERISTKAVIRTEERRGLSGSNIIPSNCPQLSSYLLTIPHVTKARLTSVNDYTVLYHKPKSPHRN